MWCALSWWFCRGDYDFKEHSSLYKVWISCNVKKSTISTLQGGYLHRLSLGEREMADGSLESRLCKIHQREPEPRDGCRGSCERVRSPQGFVYDLFTHRHTF